MKIKEKNEKINLNLLLPIFLAATVLSVILRFVQCFGLIDFSTGFYTKSSFVTVLFYVLVAAVCVCFCAVSFLSAQSKKISSNGIKSNALFAVTLVFGVSMLIDGATAFFSSLESALEGNTGYLETTVFKQLMGSGSVPDFIRSVFALLGAVYVFILAASFKTGSSAASSRKLLALCPVCWSAFRMIGLFVSKISFLRVSDLLLEIVMLSFMTLFFMAFAQVTSGVYSDGFSWRLPAFGLCAGLVAGTLSVTRLVLTIVSKEKYINSDHPFCFADLAFFAFVAVFVCVALKNSSNNELEAAETENQKPEVE